MYFNEENDYIVKAKKGKLYLKSNINQIRKDLISLLIVFICATIIIGIGIPSNNLIIVLIVVESIVLFITYKRYFWKLIIENGNIYVRSGNKKYVINIKDIINIKKFLFDSISHYQDSLSVRSKMRDSFIKLEYLKNDKVHIIELPYKQQKMERVFLNCFHNSKKIYVEEKEVEELINYFITKNQIVENPELEKDRNYISIRTEKENNDIEQIIKSEVKKTEKELKANYTQAIIILMVVVLIFLAIVFRNDM